MLCYDWRLFWISDLSNLKTADWFLEYLQQYQQKLKVVFSSSSFDQSPPSSPTSSNYRSLFPLLKIFESFPRPRAHDSSSLCRRRHLSRDFRCPGRAQCTRISAHNRFTTKRTDLPVLRSLAERKTALNRAEIFRWMRSACRCTLQNKLLF